MAKTQSNLRNNVDTEYLEPQQYNVVFHNDDVTTMEFVVSVLQAVFRKTEEEADALMLKVHHEGSAVVGTYSLDVAASKANKTMRMAKQNGYPLKVTVEEA